MSEVKYTQEYLQQIRDIVAECGTPSLCKPCTLWRQLLAEHAPTLIPTDAQAHSSGALKR